MMSESSKAGVVPKFDMHVHVSTLTSKELKDTIKTYGIPIHLRPHLPNPEITTDKLPADAIGASLGLLYSSSISGVYISVVRKGDPIPEDQRPPKRTVDPLPPNVAILAKTPYQMNVEKTDPQIAEAREKKDQQALLKDKAKRGDERGLMVRRRRHRPRRYSEIAAKDAEISIIDLMNLQENRPLLNTNRFTRRHLLFKKAVSRTMSIIPMPTPFTLHRYNNLTLMPWNASFLTGGYKITFEYASTMLRVSSFPILQLWQK
nr:hypothetical protein [Tanacetum cinerariifolium]